MIKNAKHILLGVQLAVSYQVQQDELLFSSESCQLVGPTIQYVPDRVKRKKIRMEKDYENFFKMENPHPNELILTQLPYATHWTSACKPLTYIIGRYYKKLPGQLLHFKQK